VITALAVTERAGVSWVEAASDLAADPVFYHWYLDGLWQGAGVSQRRAFFLPPGDQAAVTCLDTHDGAFDGPAHAPPGYPPRRRLWWCRSRDASVRFYRVDQQADGGDWTAVGRVPADPARWSHEFTTPRLADLTDYAWRVIPIDAAGNDGTPVALDAERIVRTPDAPDWTVAFDDDTQKVTIIAAA